MEKYEKPVMEVLTIKDDSVFTLNKSNGDGEYTEGEW